MSDDQMTFREITITRIFAAPRELVWRAWTDPDQLAVWWGPAGMTTPRDSIDMDLRPGGVFRLTMVSDADGSRFPSDMTFRKIEEPSLLAFDWEAQRGIGAGGTTLTFRDHGAGTELVNHYAGYITDQIAGFMTAGINQQYDKLEALLGGSAR